MGDINCRRCGEPWDLFGIPHSAGGYANDADADMTVEEGKKMMRGEGCPSCVGKELPKDGALEAALSSVVEEHEDPDSIIYDQMDL